MTAPVPGALTRNAFYGDAVASAETVMGHPVARLAGRFAVDVLGLDVVSRGASRRPDTRLFVVPPVREKLDLGP